MIPVKKSPIMTSSNNLYSSPNIIRMMGRACNMHGEKRNACRVLVGKPEGKRPLG
jgi:hypothetical protein